MSFGMIFVCLVLRLQWELGRLLYTPGAILVYANANFLNYVAIYKRFEIRKYSEVNQQSCL